METIHALRAFEHNPVNAEILNAVEIELDKEIKAENLADSTNSADDAPNLSFHSKVDIRFFDLVPPGIHHRADQ